MPQKNNQALDIGSKELNKLHTNQRLLIKEMQRRWVSVSIIDANIELIEANLGDHHEFILDRFYNGIPYVLAQMTSDKYLTKQMLRKNNIQVPNGEIFDIKNIKSAMEYTVKNLNFPIVTKPNWGSHGDNIFMNINSIEKLFEIVDTYQNMPFIIEEQFEGKEYRIFITKNGDYAVLHREQAHIIWNGQDTIEILAEKESYKRMNPRTNSLCPIVIDDEFLEKNKKTRKYIAPKWEKVYVTSLSNIAKWWICENINEIVHPSAIEIAKKVLETFKWLPYAGIDFLTTDITKEQTKDTYKIIEVNTNPGFSMHMLPGRWKPLDVAKMVVDLIFPETVGESI